jgi:hypothetical protein
VRPAPLSNGSTPPQLLDPGASGCQVALPAK